jgi:hypothetical protein
VEPGRSPGYSTANGPYREQGEPGSVASGSVACSLCGAPLSVSASETGLSAQCSGCSTTFEFVLSTGAAGRSGEPSARENSRRPYRGGPETPRIRPCRNCGGALRFTTNPDGLVTGICDSCGNRFTLPPRRNGPDSGRGYPSDRRRGFTPGVRRPGEWRRSGGGGRPGSGFRPRGRLPARREQGHGDDEDELPRNSRRRRDQ